MMDFTAFIFGGLLDLVVDWLAKPFVGAAAKRGLDKYLDQGCLRLNSINPSMRHDNSIELRIQVENLGKQLVHVESVGIAFKEGAEVHRAASNLATIDGKLPPCPIGPGEIKTVLCHLPCEQFREPGPPFHSFFVQTNLGRVAAPDTQNAALVQFVLKHVVPIAQR